MKKVYFVILLLLFLLFLILISSCSLDVTQLEDAYSILEYRFQGAVITIIGVIIIWIIMYIYFFKSVGMESKVKKENMSNRYIELEEARLNVLGINHNRFKSMISKKIIDIYLAMSNFNYELLKLNLTNDLYKSYVSELKKLKSKGYKNIFKDIEIVDIKIFNIEKVYDVINVSVYINVRMYDYIVNENNECIFGDFLNKVDFEFELTFIDNGKGDNINEKYIMSKKICVNDMEINNKDI